MTKPTFIDLFSGAGGLALGFEMAGFRSVFAVERDPAAAATYRRNFGDHVFEGQIEELREIPVTADVVIGGPPCQGFSPLGVMSPAENHSDLRGLWAEFLRVVRLVRPQAFVVENVPEFLRSEEFHRFKTSAQRSGYDIALGILKAEQFGVPQRRRRGVAFGSRMGTPMLPIGNMRVRTVRDAIGDLPLKPDGRNWHIGRDPKPSSLERYKCVPPGGNRFDLQRARPDLTPDCWIRKKTGSTDVFGRLEWNKPSLTIRTEFFKPEKGRYLHPQANRPITHREAARLQTFPDTFVFEGSKIEVARQIGNAVPPMLGKAIAQHVKQVLVPEKLEVALVA